MRQKIVPLQFCLTWRACFDCLLLLEEKADQAPVGVPAESPYCSRPKLVVGVFASLPEVGLARRDVARGLTPSFSSNEINIKKKNWVRNIVIEMCKNLVCFLTGVGTNRRTSRSESTFIE